MRWERTLRKRALHRLSRVGPVSDTLQSNLSAYQCDIAAALIADWWRRQIVNNTATFVRGTSRLEFARLADGSWAPPRGQAGAQLTQTGQYVLVCPTCKEYDPDLGNHFRT